MSSSSNGRNAIALAAICVAALMFGLEISSVPIALPVIEKRLHASFQDLQWIMNAYTIACTTVLMATGTLADRFGRKRIFTITIIAFGGASLMCGLATDTLALIVSRFVQGMAGGAMFICSIAVLSHQFPEGAERGRAFAIWGVVAGIGLGFGPIIGGEIVTWLTWPWVFLIHVPIALLTAGLTYAGVRESRDPEAKKLDLAGTVTLTVGIFALTYYITQGADLGFLSPTGLEIAAIAFVGFAAFLAVERSVSHPMFDFSVFRIRNFSGAIIGCIGMNFSYWPFMIFLPIYFSAGLGYDSTTTGLALLAYTIPFLAMPPVAQYLLARWGARAVIPLGLFMIGLGFLLMRLGSGLDTASGSIVLAGALIAGMGLGLTTTPATNMTTGSVSADRAGMASGLDTSARLITLAVNIAAMGAILVAGILAHLHHAGLSNALPLRAVAEKIAAGNVMSLSQDPSVAAQVPASLAHAALVHGIGWVMLYGGIGVWILAAASFVTFGSAKARASRTTLPHPEEHRAAMRLEG